MTTRTTFQVLFSFALISIAALQDNLKQCNKPVLEVTSKERLFKINSLTGRCSLQINGGKFTKVKLIIEKGKLKFYPKYFSALPKDEPRCLTSNDNCIEIRRSNSGGKNPGGCLLIYAIDWKNMTIQARFNRGEFKVVQEGSGSSEQTETTTTKTTKAKPGTATTKNGLNGGAIAAIVLAVILILVITAALLLRCKRRNSKSKHPGQNTAEGASAQSPTYEASGSPAEPQYAEFGPPSHYGMTTNAIY